MSLILSAPLMSGGSAQADRVPVLLELFTSEGCSSCPPADTLLRRLDREQPVAGAELVVLSEHVDYWNSLGWKDPFSSPLFSARQREYARRLRGDVYTPEVVVDGARGMVGSESDAVFAAAKTALKAGKVRLSVSADRRADGAHIVVSGDVTGTLYVALAHDGETSHVASGENAGRALSHVAVVYSLTRATLGNELTVPAAEGPTRVVAFVQNGAGGPVVAIGQGRL